MHESFRDDGFAALATSASVSAPLMELMREDIVPGFAPSYQLCKQIYSYHPLGTVLTDLPVSLAQAQPREITVKVLGENRLIERFSQVWETLGRVGGDVLAHDLIKTSRMYGIASLGIGSDGNETSKPLDWQNIRKENLFFNTFDPLNTAGSLVLDQDPNAPDFMKPRDISVQGKLWHSSRSIVKINEQPIYIEFTGSAFGFTGRSVYQRTLYPLRSFLQSMITDQMVIQKSGLLIAKMEQPGSVVNNLMQAMFGKKRAMLKAGVTNQVLSIGTTEEIETLNMMNLDKAFTTARDNVLKNISSGSGIPASILRNETLTEGFGEGSEDAKKEARFIQWMQKDMQPVYDTLDKIAMRKAWTPEFFAALAVDYPEYKDKDFETAFMDCAKAFKATWPNPLTEPDSEKVKTEETQFKSAIGVFEVLEPVLDPVNTGNLVEWLEANVNGKENLFSSALSIDIDELQEHLKTKKDQEAQALKEPVPPKPFSNAA